MKQYPLQFPIDNRPFEERFRLDENGRAFIEPRKYTGVCEASHTQSHTQSQTGEKMYKRIDQKELDDQLGRLIVNTRKLLTKDDPEETEDADGYDVCLDPDQYEIDTDQRKCDQCYKRFSIRDLSGGTCDECEQKELAAREIHFSCHICGRDTSSAARSGNYHAECSECYSGIGK